MGDLPLVASKLAAPVTPAAFLTRPRLHQVLDRSLSVPLTVVVGAAGSGKSALVAEWSAARGDRVRRIWVSVDGGDTPERLFRHVTTALNGHEERAHPGRDLGATIDALCRTPPQTPILVVFDDIHRARSRQLVYELAALVEDAPPNVHVVLVTRADPCFVAARRRGLPEILELRNDELRLTDAEVTAVVDAHPSVDLSGAALSELTRKVDGWAAGLQLALASLARHEDPPAAIARFGATTPAVSDYLLHEVLAHLPPAARTFMLDVAVLDILSVDACRHLTGREDAEEMLAELASDNLLIEPYSDDSYRYHPLFQQLLRLQLEQADPDRARGLHRQAAAYEERHGDVINAIGHLLEAHEHAGAVALCLRHVDPLVGLGASGLILGWLGRIPEHFSADPNDQLDAALLALRAGDVVGSARRLEQCSARFGPTVAPSVRWRIALLRSHCHHRLGDPEAALSTAAAADELVDGLRHGPELDPLRVPRAFGLLWDGRLDAARAALQPCDADAGSDHAPNPVATGLLARVELHDGDLDASHRLVRRALGSADRAGLSAIHPDRLHALTAEAEGLVEGLASPDAAGHSVERLLELGTMHGSRDHVVVGLCLQARLRWSETCIESALGSLSRGRVLDRSRPLSPALRGALDGLEARLLIEMGELTRADLVLMRLDGTARTQLKARLLGASGSTSAALDLLAESALENGPIAHGTAMAKARVLADAGDDRASAALWSAVDHRLGDRFRRAYLEEGPAFGRLLRTLDHPSAVTIVADLDRATGRDAATVVSDRELAVLQFLPTRLTNHEIGEQLYVSLNTVKTHLKSLYRRLDVRSRDEAVGRARQLGLLALDADRPTSASALARLVTRVNDAGLERQQREAQVADRLDQRRDVRDDALELSGSR